MQMVWRCCLQTSPRLKPPCSTKVALLKELRWRKKGKRVVLEFSFGVPALANAIFPREADTYHDIRPACAVGVMCAVSTPRQYFRVVVMMRLPDEFNMMIQLPEFVGSTVLDDLPEHGGVEKALKVSSPSAL